MMVSGYGASQASPRGSSEAKAACECVYGSPYSPLGTPGLDTASPEQEGLPSILTVGGGRTDGDGESEARSDSLGMSGVSLQPQRAGRRGPDRARDATLAADDEQTSTCPDRKEPLHIAEACAAETIQENGIELAAAGTGSTHFRDSQPSLEEEQATHSTPSKEHARLSITVLEQVTEGAFPRTCNAKTPSRSVFKYPAESSQVETEVANGAITDQGLHQEASQKEGCAQDARPASMNASETSCLEIDERRCEMQASPSTSRAQRRAAQRASEKANPQSPAAEDKIQFSCLSGLKRILGFFGTWLGFAQKPSDPARLPVKEQLSIVRLQLEGEQSRCEIMDARLRVAWERVQSLEDAQAKLAAQLQEAQANTEQEHEAAEQAKSQLRAANEQVAALAASLQEAQSSAAASADQWHKVECQLAVVDGQVAALSAAAQELQRTAAASAEQKQEAESQLHAKKEEAAALTARVEELMSTAAASAEQKQQVESQLAGANSLIAALAAEVKELQGSAAGQLEELTRRVEGAGRENKSLQDNLESERASRAGDDKACSARTEQLHLLEKLLAEAREEKDILQNELESERASRAATDKTSMEQAEQLVLLQECLAEAQREIHSLHKSGKAAGESTEVQAPKASSDEESKQLQESTVRNQETKEKDSAAQESDDCIQNNTVDHVAPQEPVLVFGSFDWACTGQEPAQAGSSAAGEAAQHDDDVPLKVAAAEAVAVARKVAQQGACDLPTLATKRSVGLQVLKVFQEQKGAVAREALVVEGNALATEVVQQEDVADVKAAQEMLAVKAHCSEEEAAIEECREQEAVSEAAQEATGDPAERTTEALEAEEGELAHIQSNMPDMSCWEMPASRHCCQGSRCIHREYEGDTYSGVWLTYTGQRLPGGSGCCVEVACGGWVCSDECAEDHSRQCEQEICAKLDGSEPVGLELVFQPQQVIAAEGSENSKLDAELSDEAAAACTALSSVGSRGTRAAGMYDSASSDWEEGASSAKIQMEPTHAQQRDDEERASLYPGSARQHSNVVVRQLCEARPRSADKARQLGRASREEVAALRQRCNHLEERCASLEGDLEDASCRLGEEKLEAQQLIKQLRDELAAVEQTLHTAEREAEQLRHECQSFADEADDYAWQLQQLRQEAPDLEERITLRQRCMAMSQRIFATEDANRMLEAMLAMQSVEVKDLEAIEAELTAILHCDEQAQAEMPAQNGAQHDIASAEASAQRHEVERNLMSYVIWVENAVINDLFFGTMAAPGIAEVAGQYISANYAALQALQLDATWAGLADIVYNNPHYTCTAAPQAYAAF